MKPAIEAKLTQTISGFVSFIATWNFSVKLKNGLQLLAVILWATNGIEASRVRFGSDNAIQLEPIKLGLSSLSYMVSKLCSPGEGRSPVGHKL